MRGLSWLNPALYLHGARVAIAGIIRGGGSGAAWCPDWLAGPTLGPLVPALLSSRQRHAGGKESAHLEITNKLRLEAQDCCSSTMGPDATLDSVVATAERREALAHTWLWPQVPSSPIPSPIKVTAAVYPNEDMNWAHFRSSPTNKATVHVDCVGTLPNKDIASRQGQVTVSHKMRRQNNVFQMKEQENKNPEKSTDEAEINNLPDEEFKTIVIRMLASNKNAR